MAGTGSPEELLRRILRSAVFRETPHADLLEYISIETQAGNYDALHEHDIGVTVFGLEPGYDVRENPLVARLAGETREKLKEFFSTEGRRDSLRIAIPQGEFRAFFYEASPGQTGGDEPSALHLFWEPYWNGSGRNLLLHGTLDAESMLISEAYAAAHIALLFEKYGASIELKPAAADFADSASNVVLIGTPSSNALFARFATQPVESAILQRISPDRDHGCVTILGSPEPAGVLHAARFAASQELLARILGGVLDFPPDFRITLSAV